MSRVECLRFHVSDEVRSLGHEVFRHTGLVVFRNFIAGHTLSFLQQSTEALLVDGMRKDFLMAQSDNTPRNMTVVGGAIMNAQPQILAFYRQHDLRDVLSSISGMQIVDCPELVENIILTRLHLPGDTHGWHLDDYPLALIICLYSPEENCGGELEMERDFGQIEKLGLKEGDAYLLRSDTIRHRVTPLRKESSRVILNFTYSGYGQSIAPNGSAYHLCAHSAS